MYKAVATPGLSKVNEKGGMAPLLIIVKFSSAQFTVQLAMPVSLLSAEPETIAELVLNSDPALLRPDFMTIGSDYCINRLASKPRTYWHSRSNIDRMLSSDSANLNIAPQF